MSSVVQVAGLRAWVEKRLRECRVCLESKDRTSLLKGTPTVVRTNPRPFEVIQVDGTGVLRPAQGPWGTVDKVWVIIDRFTHFVVLLPGNSREDAQVVAERFFEGYVAYFGIPREIQSDMDPVFRNAFTSALHR